MIEILSNIAIKFQGIIGTIFGVIATLIVTSTIKNLGKIYTYFHGWEIRFYNLDGVGNFKSTIFEEAHYCDYEFEIEILNSSELPKALRDIRVRFYDSSNKLLVESIPHNESTRKTNVGGSVSDPIKIINLPSKQMIYFKIKGFPKEIKKLGNWKKAYFEAFDNRDKKIKRLIGENQ